MKLSINSADSILMPAVVGDAGYDIIAASEPNIVGTIAYGPYWQKIDYIEYDTGLQIAPEKGYHTLVVPRSSISKTNLFLRNSVGLIDNGYRGTIKLRFGYIFQPYDMVIDGSQLICEVSPSTIYKKGDRIGQLVFAKTIEPRELIIGLLDETQRGKKGFGSTDK
jgi:dUTP pyrophosphatase